MTSVESISIVCVCVQTDERQFTFTVDLLFADEIRRTLGEGTFGKVVEVRDLRG